MSPSHLWFNSYLVPLSAYETQQDFTYTPNSTTNALLFSNLIPAFFKKDSVQFTPHTFMMGEKFQTDLGALGDYTMISAYNRSDTPGSSKPLATSELPSFAYMNHDLSTCDVSSITLAASLQPHQMTAQVTAIVRHHYDLNLFIIIISATASRYLLVPSSLFPVWGDANIQPVRFGSWLRKVGLGDGWSRLTNSAWLCAENLLLQVSRSIPAG